MNNPKTTIVGILVIIGAVVDIVVGWLSGNSASISQHVGDIMTALAGLGLVAAKDGGK